jgi:hypothetical protein
VRDGSATERIAAMARRLNPRFTGVHALALAAGAATIESEQEVGTCRREAAIRSRSSDASSGVGMVARLGRPRSVEGCRGRWDIETRRVRTLRERRTMPLTIRASVLCSSAYMLSLRDAPCLMWKQRSKRSKHQSMLTRLHFAADQSCIFLLFRISNSDFKC